MSGSLPDFRSLVEQEEQRSQDHSDRRRSARLRGSACRRFGQAGSRTPPTGWGRRPQFVEGHTSRGSATSEGAGNLWTGKHRDRGRAATAGFGSGCCDNFTDTRAGNAGCPTRVSLPQAPARPPFEVEEASDVVGADRRIRRTRGSASGPHRGVWSAPTAVWNPNGARRQTQEAEASEGGAGHRAACLERVAAGPRSSSDAISDASPRFRRRGERPSQPPPAMKGRTNV